LPPPRSSRLIQYAQFKSRQRDLAGARQILEGSTRKTPDYLPAWFALAELAETEGKRDEGITLADQIISRENIHAEALLLRARLRIAKGDHDKAIVELEAMASLFPRAPQVHFHLAQAFLATGNTAKGTASLTQALTLAPNFPDAVLLQATISLRRGEFAPTATALRKLVQQRPDLLQARLLLADALRGQGNSGEALAVYEEVEKLFPKLAQPPLLRGMILVQQRKLADARRAFERALEIAPDFAGAVEQLIALDFAENKSDAAKARAEGFLTKNPTSIEGHVLLARVMITRKDDRAAEAVLQKAVAVQPDSPVPYFMLARLQLSNQEPTKAIANLESSLGKNPKSVETMMLLGIVHEQLKNFPAARDIYEKLLTVNARFGPAYNNLAYLFSEHLGQLDRALEMAQKARELLPLEPNVADTLGWILYRKGQYTNALPLLQESADRLSTTAEVHYHLGMTQYMLGEEAGARLALRRALELSADFAGHSEARTRLATLELDAAKAGPGLRATLEQQLATRKDDPILLTRLAAVLEREGAADRAFATYEAALAASPNNVTVMLGLVRLLEARKEAARALEMARAARKIAPADPAVAQVLGRLGSQSGQHTWGYSVLQEASRSRPDAPDILFDLAEAAYAVGETDDAETAMRRVLELAPTFPRAAQARRFLELAALVRNPGEASAAASAEAAVKASPTYAPALTAEARVKEAKRDFAGARAAYEAVLATYSDMVFAKQRLAILLADAKDADLKKALEYATKAREAYPEDPAVARALGIILYRQGNYSRAATLLQESAAKLDSDAGVFFHLGMARHRLKNSPEAKKSLQRALELKLPADLAAEAKKALAEIK
jgi:tetratricopeptide (TPR) repeat protein